MPAPSPRPRRVAGFPGWTHLLATLAFPAWAIGSEARLYGIDTRYDWWQGFGTLMSVLVAGVVVLVLPPAVALEAWAVARRHRWVARIPVAGYVLVGGFVAFLPMGFRLAGDTRPASMDEVTLSLAAYAIVVGAQLACAYATCLMVADAKVVTPSTAGDRPRT